MPIKLKSHICHVCDVKQRNDIAGRFCSTDCEKQHVNEHAAIRERLEKEGFVRSEETPNLWSKAGVSVTEESCFERGIDQVLGQHQSVISNPTVRTNRKRK